MTGEVTIRRAVVPDDDTAIVELLRSTMGWAEDDQAERLFRWKHHLNPAGTSPMWVAERGGELVGLRAFLRWDFVRGSAAVRAVRAVDTVTHPDHRGKGLFTALTLGALDDLRGEGVDFVFNTPNAQSLPGYRKMGWQEVGNLPAFVRLRSISSIPAVLRSRGAADLASLPCLVGMTAEGAFTDTAAVEALLAAASPAMPGADSIRTRRSLDFLRWRYVDAPLGYRVIPSRHGVQDGVVIFRLRRRLRSVEATIADVIVPHADPRRRAALVADAVKSVGGDYAIVVGQRPSSRRWVAIGRGPLLTVRSVASAAPTALTSWALTMGDVELF